MNTIFTLAIIAVIVFVFIVWFKSRVSYSKPFINNEQYRVERCQLSEHLWKAGNSKFHLSESGMYEMYSYGEPYERGYEMGILYKELNQRQEAIFFEGIAKLLPSITYLKFIRYFVAWFNRDLDKHVPLEYQQELYGVSQFGSDSFDWIGPKYMRKMNYHAGHDIAHALKNMNMACTSFVVQGEKSKDGKMLIGRNFDFTVGDEFAKTKVIKFIKPAKGIAHVFVTWPGMIGTVSGMNEKGLCVSINASRSAVPMSSATPISIIVREILQYSSNIEEAKLILRKRKSFVSETILVASAADKKAVLLEKRPEDFDIVEKNENCYVCANHFQGMKYGNDSLNIIGREQTASLPRQERVEQLLSRYKSMDEGDVLMVLRDRLALDDKDVGFQNEVVMNQLLAHHAVIFKPEEYKMWVSAFPYQLGKMVCYDMKSCFNKFDSLNGEGEIYEKEFELSEDSFMQTEEYQQFLFFNKNKEKLELIIKKKLEDDVSTEMIGKFQQSNKNYFYTWELSGDYFVFKKEKEKARKCYEESLRLLIPNEEEKQRILKKLGKL